jgi:hypothetical protein
MGVRSILNRVETYGIVLAHASGWAYKLQIFCRQIRLAMTRKRAPGGGRKPAGEFKGKSAAITTRITPTTRAGLEQAAIANRRSLSQEIEARLVESAYADRDRAKPVRALGELAKTIAEDIEQLTGTNWLADPFTAETTRSAIDRMLFHFGPRQDGEIPLPARIEKTIAAMPDEMGENYRHPLRLAMMVASWRIAWVEGARWPGENAPPPNEWDDPFRPDPTWRRWQLFQQLRLNREGQK